MPKISVIMSAYNSEKYIAEAIDSVLNQTYSNFELIITDDASSDKTAGIISEFADPRIKMVKNEKNRGLTANLNSMIAIATGDYIARIDSDDVCRQDRLEKEIHFLERHKDIYMVCSYIRLFGNRSGIQRKRIDWEYIRADLLFENFVPHSTVMFRNDGKFKYNEAFDGVEDYELWERMVGEGEKIAIIPKPLVNYRVHEEQLTQGKNSKTIGMTNQVSRRALQRMDISLSDDESLVLLKAIRLGEIENTKDFLVLRNLYRRIKGKNRESVKYKRSALNAALRRRYHILLKCPLRAGTKCGIANYVRVLGDYILLFF